MFSNQYKITDFASEQSLDLAIKKKGEEGQLVSIPVDRISKVIAVQISMSYNSVESYGMLAKFLDEIAEKDEAFFTALVENKIVVSFEKMRKFAQMDETKLIDIRRKLLREVPPFAENALWREGDERRG